VVGGTIALVGYYEKTTLEGIIYTLSFDFDSTPQNKMTV
jgi:hypothetical protein